MKDYRLLFSIIIFTIIWGTTYLGIRIAVETIPPIFVTGIRHILSALILFLYLTISQNLEWIG